MLTLSQIAQCVGGKLYNCEGVERLIISGFAIDSRASLSGQMFVALKGNKHDGHDFAQSAIGQGASALLVERQLPLLVAQIVVEDTTVSFGKIAEAWRDSLKDLKVIAVTGSNGKTTLKEMIAHVAQSSLGSLRVHSTSGNLNNHIGLPLSVLKLNLHHQLSVLEMGMSHSGEIDSLAQIGKPNVAVITNAQRAHIESFHDLKEIALAKGEIISHIKPNGTLVLNRDDPHFELWQQLADKRSDITVRSFGLHPQADVRIIRCNQTQSNKFIVKLNGCDEFEFSPVLASEHLRFNYAIVILIAHMYGWSLEHTVSWLDKYQGMPGRLQLLKSRYGWKMLDDSYNANPDSVLAGLSTLVQQPAVTNKIAILGDMLELGEQSISLHKHILHMSMQLGIDMVLCFGENYVQALEELRSASQRDLGIDTKVRCFVDYAELQAHVMSQASFWDRKTIVLLKGSRAMQLDRLVSDLSAVEVKDYSKALLRSTSELPGWLQVPSLPPSQPASVQPVTNQVYRFNSLRFRDF